MGSKLVSFGTGRYVGVEVSTVLLGAEKWFSAL